jgi:hypothetical protein
MPYAFDKNVHLSPTKCCNISTLIQILHRFKPLDLWSLFIAFHSTVIATSSSFYNLFCRMDVKRNETHEITLNK